MAKFTQDCWKRDFLTQHGMFWPLAPYAQSFVESHEDWPDLAEYQQFLDVSEGTVLTASGHKVTFVPQAVKATTFEDGYEPRIYHKGEVQTRQHNWHDFFQVLVWRMFPKTKAILNALHYHAIKSRIERSAENTRRSTLENALTQFDECGAVILSSRPELLDLIKEFSWKTLFWHQREQLQQHLKCVVFGHAIYEKAINPYVGMTAHSILLCVDDKLLQGPAKDLILYADTQLHVIFNQPGAITSPQDFYPFPLLGMPGWHQDNDQEVFYDNTLYFRPGRRNRD